MKKGKFLMAIAAFSLFSATIIACSKDDDKGDDNSAYPKTLTYQGYEIKEIKMYVGSAEGGKEVSTAGIDIKAIWKYSIEETDNQFAGTDYKFLSETEVTGSTVTTNYQYKFENGKLWIYMNNEWHEQMNGNINQLYKSYGFYKFVKTELKGTGGVGPQHINIDIMLDEAGFSSLQDMKNVSDTIMWCNFDFSFK